MCDDIRQAQYGDLIPIVQKSFDFCLRLYGYMNRFPKAQKPLLGRELIAQALSMLVLFVTAKHASAFRLSRSIFLERDVRNI